MAHHRELVITLVIAVVVAVVGVGVMALATNDTDEPVSTSAGDIFGVDGYQLGRSLTAAPPSLGDYRRTWTLNLTKTDPALLGSIEIEPNKRRPPICADDLDAVNHALDPFDIQPIHISMNVKDGSTSDGGSCATSDARAYWVVYLYPTKGGVGDRMEVEFEARSFNAFEVSCFPKHDTDCASVSDPTNNKYEVTFPIPR
jgi:hypothetical protein